MKQRVVEICKDLLLALLALVAVCLLAVALNPNVTSASAAVSMLLTPFRSEPTQEDLPLAETRSNVSEAARPLAISVMTPSGRSSCQHSAARVDSAYLLLGSLLGEALDTASDGEQISEQAYREALHGVGVSFLYGLELPVATLAAWLGAESGVDATADQLLLAVEGERVALYLCGSAGCLRYATRTRAEALRVQLDTFLPDGSAFAFETEDPACASLHPLTLLDLTAESSVSGLDAAIPGSSLAAQAATSLGLNAFGSAAYTDADGATVYNETGFSLRYNPSGTLLLTNQLTGDSRFSAQTLTQQIELARSMLADFLEGFSGEGRLQLSSWNIEEDTTVLTFDYLVGGIPVLLPDNAAEVTFSGARLTHLRLTARSYTTSAAKLSLLPIRQAAAIVEPGTRLGLYYADGAAVTAGWLPS